MYQEAKNRSGWEKKEELYKVNLNSINKKIL